MADIQVTGYGDSYEDGQVYCGKLDTFGRTITRMFWVDYSEGEHSWYGWYDGDWEVEYNDVKLAPGEGLWFTSPSETIKIQTSGQVLAETLPVVLDAGNQLCPNPTPVTVDMGSVFVAGYGDSYEDGQIYCGKLDTFGRTITRMFWVDYSEGEDSWYGWYDGDWEAEYNDETIAAGEALWFTSPTAGWTLNWPSPITK